MSASLRTRDGSPSVAGVILASEKAAARYAAIDMEGALAWARDNRVNLTRAKRPLDRINAERVKLLLPPFRVTARRGGAAPVQKSPEPVLLAPIAATENELLERIATYTGTLTGLVTSGIAGWLLKLNTENRPLDHKGVDRFRRILVEGGWVNTGEPIIVSRDGILNDGQHRLAAIVAARIPAELDVRFGIARGAFHATGTGRRRTAGQVLGIEGHSNTSCVAAITRLLHHYDRNQMGQYGAQVEIAEILRMVEADQHIGQIAAKVQRTRFGPTRTGSFGFVLVVAARSAPIDAVFAFADGVASGLAQDESYPPRRLFVKFNEAANKRERISQIDMAALTVKAWNAWIEGRPTYALRVIETERTSAGFPRVSDWPAGGRPEVAVPGAAETH